MEPDQDERRAGGVDWPATVRLAAVFSVLAGLGALLLAGRLPETTIVVTVIVIGTMLSWFHLEDTPSRGTPTPLRVRSARHRR